MASPRSAVDVIAKLNAGREPERLAMKMAIMRSSPFAFLRGSAALFWLRVQEAGIPAKAPAAWCSCDQHLENFGSYRGDNGLTYFDLNDFDEAALAPCEWEMLRLLTSLMVAAPALGLAKPAAREYAHMTASAYISELAAGKARWIERKTATGAIDALLSQLKKNPPTRLLDRRTIVKKGVRHLDPDSPRMLPISDADRTSVEKIADTLGQMTGAHSYFKLLDARRRIAGTGSLGLQRFVLLVEGKGSPDGNVLLDLKTAIPSSMVKVVGITQPKWTDEAHRVVTVQHWCQAISPGQLRALSFEGKPFVLKELQPDADRLNLARIVADKDLLADALTTMARLVAWAQLRSSGRSGASSVDALLDYAKEGKPAADRLVDAARDLEAGVLGDYKAFCKSDLVEATAKRRAED